VKGERGARWRPHSHKGAIDQIIANSFPSGSMAALASGHTTSSPYNLLFMISAISRKDFMSDTQDNKAYVNGELSALSADNSM
jgi:hypothetical protein